LIDAAAVDSEVVAVFAHEDSDAVEPAHVQLEQRIRDAFAARGYDVNPAVPAWEMEAWLMQWPEAFKAYRPKWRSIDAYRGRHLGLIVNAKETLTRALRPAPSAGNVRDYRESDSPALAALVTTRGLIGTPSGRSDSFTSFAAQVSSLCAGPVGPALDLK
jgi:hypothetical protein